MARTRAYWRAGGMVKRSNKLGKFARTVSAEISGGGVNPAADETGLSSLARPGSPAKSATSHRLATASRLPGGIRAWRPVRGTRRDEVRTAAQS